MNFYQAELMDHYRYPKNQGTINNPDFSVQNLNPSCGDEISLQACITNGYVTDIKFMGKGCVISQAAASMLTVKCINQPIKELADLDKNYMLKLVGLDLGPTRLRCALLVLEALHAGISDYYKRVNQC